MDLIVARPAGLYCPPGDFYIDPWRPVERAVITHAHSDHARAGHAHYLCQTDCAPLLRKRLGDVTCETLAYGETVTRDGVRLSLTPAGHVLGSAQIRVEYRGRVWAASGDYKIEPDGVCAPFEPVRCETFITESTFALPIYRWRPQAAIFADIAQWRADNAAAGRASVIYAYGLGKAQRILRHVDPAAGPIVCHGAVEAMNALHRAAGVPLPATIAAADLAKAERAGALVIAPPSAAGSPWLRRFGDYSDAFASGWMLVRGNRRRRGFDQGFALSDHADWPGLLQAIEATGATRVLATHGSTHSLARFLGERGYDAAPLATEYAGDDADEAPLADETIAPP